MSHTPTRTSAGYRVGEKSSATAVAIIVVILLPSFLSTTNTIYLPFSTVLPTTAHLGHLGTFSIRQTTHSTKKG